MKIYMYSTQCSWIKVYEKINATITVSIIFSFLKIYNLNFHSVVCTCLWTFPTKIFIYFHFCVVVFFRETKFLVATTTLTFAASPSERVSPSNTSWCSTLEHRPSCVCNKHALTAWRHESKCWKMLDVLVLESPASSQLCAMQHWIWLSHFLS